MHIVVLVMLIFACGLNHLTSKAYGVGGGDTKWLKVDHVLHLGDDELT
jgi:hypothetical protein